MTADIATILTEARALIDTPEKWWQGAAVEVTCPADLCCAFLAVKRSTAWGQSFNEAILPLLAAANVQTPNDLILWNDAPTTTHEDVLAAFDRAIAEASNG